MVSSGDVAQMFAAQNSMFSGQQQYAQAIGMAPATGIGAFGTPSSMVRSGMAPMPGMAAPPPVVSFDPNRSMVSGYGTGNRAAAGAMSALGGMASAGAGLMFNPVGAFAGQALPTFLGGAGAGIGAGLLAAAPMAIGGFLAQKAIGSVVQGAQQQQMINTTLGQNFNFINQGSRTGQGFGRQDAVAVGDNIRALSHVPEMMTSVEELTRLIPKLKASGAMQGVRDVTEFNRRFKDAITTIRDMSKVLGTTMEEAADFFAQSRTAGYFGKTAQVKNVLNAQFTGALTGMSTGQVMAMQQQGADMASQFGARRSLGATAVTNVAQQIGLAQQSGQISEGLIEDVTGGVGGAEGVQAASQKMVGLTMQLAKNSSAGRFLMAGMVKFDKNGRALGVDEEKARRLRDGTIDMNELRRAGMGLTDKQKISFMNRQEDIAASFAGQAGPGGVANFIEGIVGNRGEEASRLVLRQQGGLSSSDADLAMSLKDADFGDMRDFGKKQAAEAAIRERSDPSMIMKRLKTRMAATLTAPLQDLGVKIGDAVAKSVEGFIDEAVGRHSVALTQNGANALTRAMSGGSQKELVDMLSAGAGLASGAASSSKAARARGGMAVVAGLAGGVGGLLGMSDGRGMKGLASDMGDYLGSTDMAAFLNRGSGTGRRADVEYEVTSGLFGSTSDSSFNRTAKYLNSGLKIDGGLAAGAASEISRMTAGMKDYRGKEDAEKLRELREGLTDRLSGDIRNASLGQAGSLEDFQALSADQQSSILERMGGQGAGGSVALLKAGLAAQRQFGGDFTTGLISAAQGKFDGQDNQINFAGLASSGGRTNFLNVKAAAAAVSQAEEGLSKAGLSDTTISMIKGKPHLRGVLSAALGGKKEVAAAINQADSGEAVRRLKELGYDNVTEADIQGLKGALDESNSGKGGGAISAALAAYDNQEKGANGIKLFDMFGDKAAELNKQAADLEKGGNKEAAAALRGVAAKFSGVSDLRNANPSKGDLEGAVSSIRGEVKGIADKALGMSEGDRSKFLAGMGSIGEAVQKAVSGGSKLKAGAGVDDVLKSFHLGENDTEARDAIQRVIGAGGSFNGKEDKRKELVEAVAGIRSLRGKAGDTVNALDKDAAILKTLSSIDDTLKITNTVLVNQRDSGASEETKKYVNAHAPKFTESN
jgi:hypothetical protein